MTHSIHSERIKLRAGLLNTPVGGAEFRRHGMKGGRLDPDQGKVGESCGISATE
jgi:hypothetical protein